MPTPGWPLQTREGVTDEAVNAGSEQTLGFRAVVHRVAQGPKPRRVQGLDAFGA